MRALAVLVSHAILTVSSIAGNNDKKAGATSDQLVHGFIHPPDSIKPWVYWYWISDNISREGITRDLEAMARVGIGEALIGNIGLDDGTFAKVPALSEEWWQCIEHAIHEGKRVGVDIGLFNCPGWRQSGGPWVKSTEAMRYLVGSEVIVEGGREIRQKLERPKEMFQDVRVLAYPLPEADQMSIARLNPTIAPFPP
jgi:hypothetical protein